MFKIKDIRKINPNAYIETQEYIAAVSENRQRVRKLAELITQASGTFTSASLVVLFFLIRETPSKLNGLIILALFWVVILLSAALMFAILSAHVRSPVPSATHGHKLSNDVKSYHAERRWLNIAIFCIAVAIFCFISALVLFAFAKGYSLGYLSVFY